MALGIGSVVGYFYRIWVACCKRVDCLVTEHNGLLSLIKNESLYPRETSLYSRETNREGWGWILLVIFCCSHWVVGFYILLLKI